MFMGIFDIYNRQPKQEITKDSPKRGLALFFDVLRWNLWELIKLNLLFILFCIPIITIPAALTAMSRIISLMLRSMHYDLFSDFFGCFKREFLRSLIIGIVFSILIAVSVSGIYFYDSAISSVVFSLILRAILSIIMVACIIAGFFAFPMTMMTDLPVKHILRNSFLLVAVMLPYNAASLRILDLLWFLAAVFLPYSLIIVLIILFSLSGLITTFCALSGINKYIKK